MKRIDLLIAAAVAMILLSYPPLASSQRKRRNDAKPQAKTQAQARSETQCELCHTADNWAAVDYAAHQRTRFPLTGAHRRVSCKDCHPREFNEPIRDTSCRACHRDEHGGRLGQYCEGCHETADWRGEYNPDSHRASNFPLTGAHSFIPCRECHTQALGRAFAPLSVQCYGCHARDYEQTAFVTIDHPGNAFDTTCQKCHFTFDFTPARFQGHDVCFQINGGPHDNVACKACHLDTAGFLANGACATNNASCTRCHRHEPERTASEHPDVLGYDYVDRKCYECHRFAP